MPVFYSPSKDWSYVDLIYNVGVSELRAQRRGSREGNWTFFEPKSKVKNLIFEPKK